MLRTSLFLVRERECFRVFDDGHKARNHVVVVIIVVVVDEVVVDRFGRHRILIGERQRPVRRMLA